MSASTVLLLLTNLETKMVISKISYYITDEGLFVSSTLRCIDMYIQMYFLSGDCI